MRHEERIAKDVYKLRFIVSSKAFDYLKNKIGLKNCDSYIENLILQDAEKHAGTKL